MASNPQWWLVSIKPSFEIISAVQNPPKETIASLREDWLMLYKSAAVSCNPWARISSSFKLCKRCGNHIPSSGPGPAFKFKFNKIAAIEARGFVFASAVSYVLKKPFILLRKKNKLPADTYSEDFVLEYGKAEIEIHKDSINKNESTLIIDDLIATGGTAEAAAKLVEKSGGKIAGFIFVINLYDLGGIKKLQEKGYKTHSLMEFPGH